MSQKPISPKIKSISPRKNPIDPLNDDDTVPIESSNDFGINDLIQMARNEKDRLARSDRNLGLLEEILFNSAELNSMDIKDVISLYRASIAGRDSSTRALLKTLDFGLRTTAFQKMMEEKESKQHKHEVEENSHRVNRAKDILASKLEEMINNEIKKTRNLKND